MQGTQIVAVSTPIWVSGSAGTGGGPAGGGATPTPAAKPDELQAGFGAGGPSRARRGSFLMRCRVRTTGKRVCRMRAVATACGRKRTIAFGRAETNTRSKLVRLKLNRCGRRLLARKPRGARIRLEVRARDMLGREDVATKRAVLRPAGR